MAVRPFTFGARMREGKRTVRVRAKDARSGRYVIEDSGSDGKRKVREHDSVQSAVRDLARTWRSRLH